MQERLFQGQSSPCHTGSPLWKCSGTDAALDSSISALELTVRLKMSAFACCREAQGFQRAPYAVESSSGTPPGPDPPTMVSSRRPDSGVCPPVRKEAVVISFFRKTGAQRHKGPRVRKRGCEMLGIKTFVLATASCSL